MEQVRACARVGCCDSCETKDTDQRSDVRYATASASIRRDSEAERTTRNARPIDRYIFQMYFGIISLYEVKFVTVKKRLIAPASRRYERLRYTPQHPQ